MQLTVEGSSDVAHARNTTLSTLLDLMRSPEHAERDVVLLIDDDMVFNVAQAQQVIDHARATGCPASGVYPTAAAEIAASTRWAPPGKWFVGLGFLAIPRALIERLAAESPYFERRGRRIYEFTNSALHEVDGELRWYGEDYWLCKRLGGVDLLPIAIGHLKMIPLTVDEETLRKVREGIPLTGEPTPFRVTTGAGGGYAVKQGASGDGQSTT